MRSRNRTGYDITEPLPPGTQFIRAIRNPYLAGWPQGLYSRSDDLTALLQRCRYLRAVVSKSNECSDLVRCQCQRLKLILQ